MSNRGKVGAKRTIRNVTFQDWVGGENGLKFATREQVVAFWNMALEEQVVPLLANLIRRYDAEKRARSLRGRLRRWFRRLLGRPMTRDEVIEEALLAQQREEHEASPLPGPLSNPEPESGVVGGIGRPEDNGRHRQSCVVCGSHELEPVNERGGLKCANGHIIEEPPLPDDGTRPEPGDTGRGPGSPGGPA